MPIVPGDGGGSTPQICAVSPSDQAGQIDNILSRLDALENAISQLATTNVTASQLSDISQQIGWVYGVTYMGVEGWTQTAAGTLIPPAGVSLSSLGILPNDNVLVSYDAAGNLLIGFDQTTGAATGTLPVYWNAGGAVSDANSRPYCHHSWNSAGPAYYDIASGITYDSDSISEGGISGAVDMTVTEAGVYYASCSFTGISPGVNTGGFSVIITNEDTSQQIDLNLVDYDYSAAAIRHATAGAQGIAVLSGTETIRFAVSHYGTEMTAKEVGCTLFRIS